MSMKKLFCSAVVAGLATVGNAECPNGCNGHGKCTSYDMCICNRNWQANDCSERVCQFGLAHVDTPKGDLDMSGSITGPDLTIAENSFVFPYGTSEQFPQGRDSDLREVTNSAHYYMECSNKGTCNRDTGECECFDGYDGAACQRASCPGYPDSCSGHGVCKTIKQLAHADHSNVYELWDKHSTMGCECDEGFSGPDCSERKCKNGIDPLYYDDSTTIKYATWDFALLTNSATIDFYNGQVDQGPGHWAIRFFDMHGEDWVTKPIVGTADCDEVVDALESLPNEVIPKGSLHCTKVTGVASDPLASSNAFDSFSDSLYSPSRPINYNMAFWDFMSGKTSKDTSSVAISGQVYRIKFADNPGALRQPEIETYLDGSRASLQTLGSKLVTAVWTDGQQGESVDYFADVCAGVTVTLGTSGTVVLSGLTSTETDLLKACLGGSNFDSSDNANLYDWDTGDDNYPHLIKLVQTTGASGDGGYYVALKYSGSNFFLYNQFVVPDGQAGDNFDVYTTKGVLARTSLNAKAQFGFGSNEIATISVDGETTPLQGDLACEINDNNILKKSYWTRNTPLAQSTCLNKTDIFTVLSTTLANNPVHINLYTVEKIYQKDFFTNDASPIANNFAGTFVIKSDLSTNFATVLSENFFVYKFFPSSESSYRYVSECSNRGICNTDTGLCECFGGYTDDDCSSQNSLSV